MHGVAAAELLSGREPQESEPAALASQLKQRRLAARSKALDHAASVDIERLEEWALRGDQSNEGGVDVLDVSDSQVRE